MACAINLGSSVILTGGYNTRTTVSEYNEAGWVRDLPALLQKRWSHGCTYYTNDEGIKVIYNIDNNHCPTIMIFQTYLVSGGYDYDGGLLSSTELLVETATAWVLTGELPSPRSGLRAANIDN